MPMRELREWWDGLSWRDRKIGCLAFLVFNVCLALVLGAALLLDALYGPR